jgi:hypothetical protein
VISEPTTQAVETGLHDRAPSLPAPRGPLTEELFERLVLPPRSFGPPAEPDDPLGGDDAQLALYCCYELHYRSFAGVDDGWEWDPSLLRWRAVLEGAFESALRENVVEWDGIDVQDHLRSLADAPGPSLSSYVEHEGSARQLLEFLVHRSAYQLKEADPHTWAIPRLTGAAKAVMVSLQNDEYGDGVRSEMHATLFARTLDAVGLDAAYGHYLDRLPGTTLATTNVISLFGLHRRLRAALVGHLALFEMTSVVPMGRYSRALDRHGFGPEARRFYDVHVEADEVHQVVAARDLVGGLVREDPAAAAGVAFGASAGSLIEARMAAAILDAWNQGCSSLRPAGEP